MFLLGVLVIWFRPDDRVAWVNFSFSLALTILAATNFESISTHVFAVINQMSLVLVGIAAMHLSVLFPKPLPFFQNNRWQSTLYIPLLLLPIIPKLYSNPNQWHYCFYLIIAIASFGVMAIAISSLLTALAKSSSALAKRQAYVVLIGSFLGAFPTVLAYTGFVAGTPSLFLSLSNLLLLCFPAAIAYAILRHRLFDIEVIIKRTVVYALVSAALTSTYFILLAGGRALLGEQSSLLTNILATAVIAVAFAPLRDHTKRAVDRIFFRTGYDFQQILNNFSETARLTFEPKQLLTAFIDEIEGALHPSLISIFLSQGDRLVLTESRGVHPPHREIDLNQVSLEAFLSGKIEHPINFYETGMLIPLMVKNELLGLVSMGSRKSDLPYKMEDHTLVNSLCQQMALWLKNAQLFTQLAGQERLQKELEIAHAVQTGFLPASIPDATGLEIAALSRPALEVGGDFYDIIRVAPNRLGILIGDVSGKGVPAALLMAMTLSIFRTIATDSASPAETLKRLNTLVHQNKPSPRMFVTALYAVYDELTHIITFANAGHNFPVSHRGAFPCIGTALGIFRQADYEEQQFELAVGETLLLTTDGVEDAINPDGQHFGEQYPLEQMDILSQPPQPLIDALIQRLDIFIDSERQFDDITLVALKRA